VLPIGGSESYTADRVEVGVMVTGDNEFMRMRQRGIEIERCLEFCRCAMIRYVAGVNKDVAIWNVPRIEGVSVWNADYANRSLVSLLRAAQGDEVGNQTEKEMEWLAQYSMDQRWPVE
jgi:hypothetical protein